MTSKIKNNEKKRQTTSLASTAAILTASILLLSTFAMASTFTHQASAHLPPDIEATLNSASAPSADNFELPEGYSIEAVFWNLTLPTAVTFDDNGTMYIAEAGFAYGGLMPQPRILKAEQDGHVKVLVDRMLMGPINDIEFHEGKLYVSHRGIISSVDPATGLKQDLIVGLPSVGDHHNNEIVFGPDGRLYWGQGTATNSGVVGMDNYHFGWLKIAPKFHDMPGQNITLAGENFETPNPLTPPATDMATTGAFVPFGNATQEGQTVKSTIKCSGCIISANPDGTDLQVEAWGLRNPFGLAFGEDGNLLVTMNGADERGSRPIAGDTDKIYSIYVSEDARFYGWPDFYGDAEPVTEDKFQSTRGNQSLEFLMQDHPPVEEPLAEEDVAAALTGADFSTSSEFGHEGMAFIAEFGTMAPATHSPEELETPIEQIGHRVIVLDPETGNHTDFLTVRQHDDAFRPVGVTFNEQENALYVVSIAKAEIRTTLPNGTPLPMPTPWFYPFTGVVWKITADGGQNATRVSEADQQNATTETAVPSTNTTDAIPSDTGTDDAQQRPSIELTQTEDGLSVTVRGTGFSSGDAVTLQIEVGEEGTETEAFVAPDESGTFEHTFSIVDANSGETATVKAVYGAQGQEIEEQIEIR